MDELREIAAQWAAANNALRLLPADELTATDKRKLDHLQATIRRHLDSYGFRSFQPGEISLSRDNFRPLVLRTEKGETVEKELNFQVSASDAIRTRSSGVSRRSCSPRSSPRNRSAVAPLTSPLA